MCLVVLRCGCSPGGDLLGREICRTGADGFGSVDPGRIQGGVLEVENPDLESFFGGVDHGFLLLMSLE